MSLSHRILLAEGILIRLKRCYAILKDFKELEYNSDKLNTTIALNNSDCLTTV